ncbi:MAG: RluA family pseudouridine synthase [Candidatus Latescibacterota bacterium]|nr:MAG: RluA family pseudouridine synthase [Candidatus Latescibacterota bacterium]
MEELHLHVDASMQGTRIDRLLAAHFQEITRSRFQKLLRDGRVTASGRKVRSAYRVLEGDEIRVRVPPPEPSALEPEEIPLTILHEDDDVLVLDKPAGLVVHPAAGHRRGTLVHALLHHIPRLATAGESPRPGIVHRLDKDTSGLMVVAKNERAHARLAEALQKRDVSRTYTALVWGNVRLDEGLVEQSIGRDPVDRKRMSVRSRKPRAAVTRYCVRERLQWVTLVEMRLDTGRTHQIRVHMASLGHPVFGDATYGGRNSRLTRLPAGLRVQARRALKSMPRQALHATRLSFQHPATAIEMVFESPLPDDFSETLAMMRRSASGAR